MPPWVSSGLLFLGIALFAALLVWQLGNAKYDQGFSSGSSQAVISCKAASDEAESTATKDTKQIIKVSRSASRDDDIKWLKSRGLYAE